MDRDSSIRCGHPNVFGCPNHSLWAKNALALLTTPLAADGEAWLREFRRDEWPCGFVLTEKGHNAAADIDTDSATLP
jgi:hypothetical protein